ncbi:MAG: DNA methyltransferase, partial [Candidatus Nealsonbacteria bacterium]|nr:DNA methyltransferase [Candidatus Nealsonbacteria bacterium]
METQGIKYTGSKREILPALLELIRPLNVKTILDGFSGTTRVSQALKQAGYTVYANDIADWSKAFGECYLLNRKPTSYYLPIIEHLNKLPGKYGWFSENYGGEPNGGSAVQEDGKKRIWQLHNTKKLDAIREEIDKIAKDEIEKSVLLTSLIIAMDKVDSSVGHQVSYLKKWAPRAYNIMKMEVPRLIIDDKSHKVYQKDIFDLVNDIEVDLAYYDPPYGSSNDLMPPSRVRYASYYHIWKTICLNDKPKLVGVANRREDVGDTVSGSIFEEFRKNNKGQFIVIEAIERLIKN